VSGPNAEGGPLPAPDRHALAWHEERIAEWRRDRVEPWSGVPNIWVLSIVAPDEHSGWEVDVDKDAAKECAPGEPPRYRLFVADGEESLNIDIPLEVLQRIADRIREL
jgi:hypothetical protein